MIQRTAILAAAVVALCSCSGASREELRVTQLLDRFARSNSPLKAPFNVTAEVVKASSSAPALRFRLTNITQVQQHFEEGTLPWQNAAFDSVTGLTVNGRFLPITASFGEGIRPEHPERRVIAPGATLVGDMPLSEIFPIAYVPRDEKALLLWTYTQGGFTYSGLAYLARK